MGNILVQALPTELRVAGCIFIQKGKACFALPVLRHPNDPASFFVQEIDELSNKVSRFRLLEIAGDSAGDDAHNFEEVQQQVRELLKVLNRTARQEERVAILLNSV